MGAEGVPSDCPALRVLQAREQEILASQRCAGEKAEYAVYTDRQIDLLRQAAKIVNCPLLDKNLPDSDAPVPLFGTTERGDFANLCPAFATYRELAKAARGQQ